MYEHSRKHQVSSQTISGILILFILFTTAPLPLFALADGANLVLNSTLENPVSPGADPENWLQGGYGVNDGKLTFPVPGHDSAQAAGAVVTSYTDGDVKWFFAPVAVVAGKQYVFADAYLSESITQLTAEYFDANHAHLAYGGFFQVPANATAGVWGSANAAFVPPAGAAYMTVFHALQSVGSLTIDDISLSEVLLPHGTLHTIVTVLGGTALASDFQVTVSGGNASPGTFAGNANGTTATVNVAAPYTVTAGGVPNYRTTQSPECMGSLQDGASATCTLTETFIEGISTTLNVVTKVENTHGGVKQPADFTVTVSGGNASPSFFPGSAAGVEVHIDSSSHYSVSVNSGAEYAVALSPDCTGTVTKGDTVTCTATLTDVEPIGDGSTGHNLISNPNLESANTLDPSTPAKWNKGQLWGNNTPSYEYPISVSSTTDSDISSGKAARVSYADYTGDVLSGGDAKWYFAPVSVTPGRRYLFQDAYLANTPTYLVAEYFNSAGAHLAFAGFNLVPATQEGAWKIAGAAFTVPTGAASMSVYHQLNSTGSLTVDNFSLTEEPLPLGFAQGFVSLTFDDGYVDHMQTAKTILDSAGDKGTFYIISHHSGFGITNASLETKDPSDPAKPLGWLMSGSANADFNYPVAGHTGVGASVSSTQAESNAAWYYAPLTVFDDQSYQFSHYYKSTAETQVFIQIIGADGKLTYADSDGTLVSTKTPYAILSASTNWKQFTSEDIFVPVGTKSVTMLHALLGAGTLTIDDVNAGAYSTNMTPAQVLALQSGGHEIGGHTQTHADLNLIGTEQATMEISGGRQDLIAGGASPVVSFAYPYGNNTTATQNIARNAGFTSARGVLIGTNGRDTNKFALFSRTVSLDTKLSDIESWIDQAVADRTWLILDFHQIVAADATNPDLIYATTPDTLIGIVDYLKTKNVPVHTVKDGVALMDGLPVTPQPTPAPAPTPTPAPTPSPTPTPAPTPTPTPTPPPSSTTTPGTATTSAVSIFSVAKLSSALNSMTISWKTDRPASSQLIYDVVSHPTLALDLPNFGYAHNSPLDTSLLMDHTVKLDGLISGTLYYARPVSENNAGEEVSFTLLGSSTPPTPTPTPAPTPTPTPAPATGGGSSSGIGSATFNHFGCMNPLSVNYDRLANKDDGSCIAVAATTTVAATTSPANVPSPIAPPTPPIVVTSSPAIATTSTAVSGTVGQVLGANTYNFIRKIKFGSRGDDVSQLQKRLTELGFYFGPITGYFGNLTSSAVRVFQAAHGLDSVGSVGAHTIAALNQSSSSDIPFIATSAAGGKLLSSVP